ncbi:MAG: hypothetical protein GY810_10115 [Aureispira sp.]|nr:hypothetical protein [Aureispira sp.]
MTKITINPMKYVLILIFFSCLFSFNNPTEVTCSTIFKSIGISVENEAGQPITVDDYYTIQLSDGDTIRGAMIGEGNYTVASDRQHDELLEKQDSFMFVGIKDSVVVVQETFIISGDKCHINQVSGTNKVVLK